MRNLLTITIEAHGYQVVATACNVKDRQLPYAWAQKGKLPDTEYLPKDHRRRTHYAEAIAKLAGAKRKDFL